ncbi:MAG TPA: PKD domain-containing protein [Crocinitomicaceae bacterium]|nr:PKD domain-containing protein [Crocinitomicaceae bacterium]
MNVQQVFGQQCIDLTGNPQWVNIGDLDVTGDQLTVEALIFYRGGVNIVSKHTGPPNVNYLLRVGTLELTTTNGFQAMSNPYASSMQLNRWYHVAGTYDGSYARYYVNGCLVTEQPLTGNLVTNDFNTAIGNISGPQTEQFNGKIDEVRIWNVARTEAQIKSNMFDLPNPTTQTGLLGYYKMNGNVNNLQGNTAYDGMWVGSASYNTEPTSADLEILTIQSVTPTTSGCPGVNSGSINVSALGTNLTYSLDGTNYQSSNTFSNLAPNTYTVYVKGQEGCILQNSNIVVGSLSKPTATYNATTACLSEVSSFTDASTANISTWNWSFGDGNTSTNQSPSHTFSSSGTYNVKLVVTNSDGCKDSITKPISVFNLPTADFNFSSERCMNDVITLTDNSTNGDGTINSYTWDFNTDGTPDGSGNTATTSYSSASTYSVQLVVQDGNGCRDTVVKPITILPAPTVNAGIDTAICSGESVTLKGNGATNYSWSGGVVDGTAFTPTNTQTYTLTATDANGCIGTDQVTITVNPLPNADFSANQQKGCDNLAVTFTNNSGVTNASCYWSFGDGTTSTDCESASHSYTANGTYNVSLVVTSVAGCSTTISKNNYIEVVPSPTADFDANPMTTTLDATQITFTNQSLDANNYSWNFGDNSPNVSAPNTSHTYSTTEANTYTVTLTAYNALGCSSTVTKTIVINDPQIEYQIPNVFTPNNDGSNDEFLLINPKNIKELEIVIVNRWGNVVYSSSDLNFKWNGKSNNGADCTNGTYFYTLKMLNFSSKTIQEQGFIQLVR